MKSPVEHMWMILFAAVALFSIAESASGVKYSVAQKRAPAAEVRAAGSGAKVQLDATDQELANFFHGYVSREVKRWNIPGASLVVVRNGRVILAQGYGYADIVAGRALTTRTVIRQLSIAKVAVWLLAMKAHEQGRLNLDRDINEYLDFDVRVPSHSKITMRNLMTHTAGFADTFPASSDGGKTLRDELAASIPEVVYKPGTTIAYSNYGAALAALIVERVYKRPFDTLVQQEIFSPLGMRNSSTADPAPAALRSMLASYYSAESRAPYPIPRMDNMVRPIGGLISSADDMARLLSTLLPGSVGSPPPMVSQKTLATMMRVHHPLGPDLKAGLGLGFIVGEYRGIRLVGHGGSFAAGATDLQLLPDHGLGWHIAFNGRGYNGAAPEVRGRLLRSVIDQFLVQRTVPVQAQGPSTAQDVAGQFLSTRRPRSSPSRVFDALSLTTASAVSGGLLAIDVEGTTTLWLPQGADRFRERATGLPLVATRDEDGRVIRFASPLLNAVAEFERAPAAVRWARALFLASFPVLLLAALAPAAQRLLRRRKEHPLPAGVEPTFSPAAAWLLLGIVVAWTAALLTGLVAAHYLILGLQLLTLAAVTAAIWKAGSAAAKLRASMTWRRRVPEALYAASVLLFSSVLIALELTPIPVG